MATSNRRHIGRIQLRHGASVFLGMSAVNRGLRRGGGVILRGEKRRGLPGPSPPGYDAPRRGFGQWRRAVLADLAALPVPGGLKRLRNDRDYEDEGAHVGS